MQKIKEAEKLGVLKVIHVTKDLLAEGWELFKGRPDKEWSLTDCISFVVMKRRRCQRLSLLTSTSFRLGLSACCRPNGKRKRL
jgi:predicted nucleic acid-binding protein